MPSLQTLIIKGIGSLHRHGISGTWHRIKQIFAQDDFDRKYGVDTGGRVPFWFLDMEDEPLQVSRDRAGNPVIMNNFYRAVLPDDMADVIHSLKIDPRNFSFVDLGCGKGRALIIAAELGFTEIIGVEFSSRLAEIARRNISKLKLARTCTILTMDAGNYEAPPGNIIVFLYNPFGEDVMQRVMSKLSAHRGELWIVYCNPQYARVIDRFAFVKRIPFDGEWAIWRRL